MQKPHLRKLNEKTNQISNKTRKFLGQQVPDYIKNLPSIKNDLRRWVFNVIFFIIGFLYDWAVYAVLHRIPNLHKFPSSVAGMIVLLVLLLISHAIFPKFTDNLVKVLDPYFSFALRSMNIMFVPAFCEMVKNPSTTGPEVGRMICIFIVAYIIGFTTCTVLVRVLRLIIFSPFLGYKESSNDTTVAITEKIEMPANPALDTEEAEIGSPGFAHLQRASSVVTIPIPLRQLSDDDGGSCASTLTGKSSPPIISHQHDHPNSRCCMSDTNALYEPHHHHQRERHGPLHAFAVWCMEQSNFDDLTLFIIFCICAFVFLPLSHDSPAMPFFRLFLYFSMTLLLYSAASRMPAKMKIIIHPIIVTSACVLAGLAYFERVKGFDIIYGVNVYKTGISFISLVEKTDVGWPGGGDILSAAMDVSIISLAFNVYKSRPTSLRQWAIITCSIVPMAFLIMFVTPLFAHGIGLPPSYCLVWSSRSVTTAIGIVIAEVLGSNQSVVTCIIVFTGITGPLIGPYLLKLARVKDDDYMTIGITMGSNSHGVGTAYLITKNPKASGMASIAFAMFGTIGVIVASIPVLSDTIKHLSGYSD
ncbi:LrgB-like family-domain-containing protein [Cokeromyces recurvatus]|uniref:LrgB-like family-domain-containing protein n=1 Tax=Cokeromyces recurvatus TaxID=90255 RepID=UPI00221E8164|nr:LrgB-like family-domain-containing protein [Cokeromyces recurvatus]KAI7907437.1 LrgB-like family-domain-containing protein [Cokeromyces recurvatus]